MFKSIIAGLRDFYLCDMDLFIHIIRSAKLATLGCVQNASYHTGQSDRMAKRKYNSCVHSKYGGGNQKYENKFTQKHCLTNKGGGRFDYLVNIINQ